MNYDESLKEEIQKMEKAFRKENFNEEEISAFKKIFEEPNPNISNDSKNIGLFFYYHLKIENSIERMIKMISPEIKIKEFGIKHFSQKLKVLKSLTPNASRLKIFPLLEQINQMRNYFAHTNIEKNSDDLIQKTECLRKAWKEFGHNTDIQFKITNNRACISINLIIATRISRYIDLLTTSTQIGANKDIKLKIAKIARSFSHKLLSRRFSILVYMFQTGIKSQDAPKDFYMVDEFRKDLEELKTIKCTIPITLKMEQ